MLGARSSLPTLTAESQLEDMDRHAPVTVTNGQICMFSERIQWLKHSIICPEE